MEGEKAAAISSGSVSEVIPYPVLLTRAGCHFALTDKRLYDVAAQLWRRQTAQIESKEYLLPSLLSKGSDTVEVVKFKKRGRGGLIVRATVRYIEAHEIIRRAR